MVSGDIRQNIELCLESKPRISRIVSPLNTLSIPRNSWRAPVDIESVERALPRQTVLSRRHRSNPTPAEEVLWQRLRRRQLDGLLFRRQFPVGPYFADFFCVAVQLAIETDGPSHEGRQRRDRLRDTFFRKRGIVVLRFTNDEVLHRPAAVFEHIRRVLRQIAPLTK
jgi:very-short-patch-repair endonuclease